MKTYHLILKGDEYYVIEAAEVFSALARAVDMLGGRDYRMIGVVRGEGVRVALESDYHGLRDGRKVVLFRVTK